jgi:uncharacterized protein DUF4255/carboxypeptidase family protein
MFHLVDEVVRTVLDSRWPAQPPKPVFSFETPDDNFPAFVNNQATPVVNLFLYDARENREHRRAEWDTLDVAPGVTTLSQPPAYINCHYLVTAWAQGGNDPAAGAIATEHRYLGEALRILFRSPDVVPQALGLPNGGVVFTQGHIYLTPAAPEGAPQLGEFWTSMKRPWRASAHLLVTAPLDLLFDAPPDPMVISLIQRYLLIGAPAASAEERIIIGGWVLRAADNAPIANALIERVDSGIQTRTDAEGRFRLTNLQRGVHRLRASAPGMSVDEHNVTVPDGPLAEHVFTLS